MTAESSRTASKESSGFVFVLSFFLLKENHYVLEIDISRNLTTE